MYVLVYFAADKSSSVVYEKYIRWPQNNKQFSDGENVVKPGVNDIAEVLWGDKYITGKILYKSTNKTYLQKLEVNENGDLKSPPKRQIQQQNTSNFWKKQDLQTEKKTSKDARSSTQKLFNEFLLNNHSEKKKTSRLHSPEDGSNENNYVHTTDLVDEPKELANCKYCSSIPATANCEFCSSIPATAEVITALEMILSHVKMRFNSNTVKENEDSPSDSARLSDDVKEKPMQWEIPGPGKIRLVENIDVWIDAGHLMIITESSKCNANEMTRKLLIFLIGEKQLSRMSALGHGEKPAVYPKVYTAVKAYVMKHVEGTDHSFPFNRITNQLCASRAVKYGISISGNKKSRHSTELHASERTTEHGCSSKVQQKAAMEYHDWSAASCSSSRENYMSEANMKPRYGCEPNYTAHGSVEPSKTANFQPDYAAPFADDINEINEVSYFHL
ncbi:hypothetical protein PV325_008443 [Microctonus aethiopoides]|nr:hypothetical protein PV325_008443 [Microctonus aethiopoides]